MNPPLESVVQTSDISGVEKPAAIVPAQVVPEAAMRAPSGLQPVTGVERAQTLKTEVVVITENSEADLARSLPLIQEAIGVAQAELLFVDLGSADGTRAFVTRHAPGARGIWLHRGDGLQEALTAAATASEADVLVVLRPTVQPSHPDDIAHLVAHLEEHPYAAVVAPTLRAQTGAILGTASPHPQPEPFSRVEWVVSEAIAIRRADISAVAGFRRVPARTFEQLELCIKLRTRGREIHYLRTAEWRDVGGRAARRLRDSQRGLSLRAWRLLLTHPGYALHLFTTHPATAVTDRLARRVFDIVASLVLLVALSPLMLAIAVAVRIDSPGPAIFRQRRLGHRARPFQMYKFRTMRHDSDPSLHARFVRDMIVNRLQASVDSSVQVFKLHPDPRVTRLGGFLRRTSLDELPQLLNVLRGEMTLVGFRPPIPYEVKDYPSWYFRRFAGKPGLTGLWQVSGRNERSYEDMVSLDIQYFNRRNLLLDLLLLVRTAGVLFTGRGAY